LAAILKIDKLTRFPRSDLCRLFSSTHRHLLMYKYLEFLPMQRTKAIFI